MEKKEALETYSDFTHIYSQFDSLNSTEKKIARYVMELKGEILNKTTQDVGRATGTSAAAVVRFCRTLGFKGYLDLKFYIEKELLSPSSEIIEIHKDDSIPELKEKIFRFNRHIIEETQNILDDEALQKTIDAIIQANRIDIYAEGGSGITAQNFINQLMQIGINCKYYKDPIMEMTAACQLKPGDVALAISYSGSSINTVDSLQKAKESGATTICLTGYSQSPITKHSDIILYTGAWDSKKMSDLPAARISELCVLSFIQIAIVAGDYKMRSGQIQKGKAILKQKRY